STTAATATSSATEDESGLTPGWATSIVVGQLELADLVAVYLVGAVGQAKRPRAGPHAGELEVVRHAAATVCLDRPVDHLERHVGRGDLDHGDLLARHLVADGVHHVGGLQREK